MERRQSKSDSSITGKEVTNRKVKKETIMTSSDSRTFLAITTDCRTNLKQSSYGTCRVPVNTPQQRLFSPSISTTDWNSLIPHHHAKQMESITEKFDNVYVRFPFKHAASASATARNARPLSPGTSLKQKTSQATRRVAKVMAKEKKEEKAKKSGRLRRGRLEEMNPVFVAGPTMNNCRGIVAETRSYSASPSRSLQRRRQILSTLNRNYLPDRPQTGESVHQTSVASDDERGVTFHQDGSDVYVKPKSKSTCKEESSDKEQRDKPNDDGDDSEGNNECKGVGKNGRFISNNSRNQAKENEKSDKKVEEPNSGNQVKCSTAKLKYDRPQSASSTEHGRKNINLSRPQSAKPFRNYVLHEEPQCDGLLDISSKFLHARCSGTCVKCSRECGAILCRKCSKYFGWCENDERLIYATEKNKIRSTSIDNKENHFKNIERLSYAKNNLNTEYKEEKLTVENDSSLINLNKINRNAWTEEAVDKMKIEIESSTLNNAKEIKKLNTIDKKNDSNLVMTTVYYSTKPDEISSYEAEVRSEAVNSIGSFRKFNCEEDSIKFRVNVYPPKGYVYYFSYTSEVMLQSEKCWSILFGFRLTNRPKKRYMDIEIDEKSSVEGQLFLISEQQFAVIDRQFAHLERIALPVWILNCDNDDVGLTELCVPAVTYTRKLNDKRLNIDIEQCKVQIDCIN
ncbi:DgyrCDS11623 [Dimorphilus gyrociliatus]|uniref:DgyrCDS11623 n=1 Tax=Dimorphilus gyrociliatus TaxID=2664684 RepID=A0A7I8W3X1_9ANNE|nr:DgyrCDS11623 [Dimorphilus gyrociliatus]